MGISRFIIEYMFTVPHEQNKFYIDGIGDNLKFLMFIIIVVVVVIAEIIHSIIYVLHWNFLVDGN